MACASFLDTCPAAVDCASLRSHGQEWRWPTRTCSSRSTSGRSRSRTASCGSAHGTMLTGERLIAYHEARAAGGVGMSTLEATGVHANAPSVTPLYSDDVIPLYRELMARIRPVRDEDAPADLPPRLGDPAEEGRHAGLLERDPEPDGRRHPDGDDHSMIAEMVEAFAAATRRCRDGGLDGVDLHASSGYLIEQFLSPANNVRTDEYGGSLENRMRFLMEILAAIRAEVGDDYCVGIRLPNEEYIPGGLTPARRRRDRPARRAVRRLRVAAHGLVLAVPQAAVTDGRPARQRDAGQRGDHPGGRQADDRRRPDHDARPRRAHRGRAAERTWSRWCGR